MGQPVAVIGAGTMGAVIAGEFARAGCTVRLVDYTEDLAAEGLAAARRAYDVLVAAGHLGADEADEAHRRITPLTRIEPACSSVALVVEAVSEDLALKQRVFSQLDACSPEDAVLASNTSGLSITRLAEATDRPHRVAGMHFWNPPHIVPLVEVTRGEHTSAETAEHLLGVCRELGKRPILVRHDIPGFVGNRIQYAALREALHLLAQGVASAEDIDTAMTAGPGLRYGLLGPLRTADLGGLDVFLAICRYLFQDLSAAQDAPDLLADLVKNGHLGAKSGSGFYDYATDDLRDRLAQRDRVLLGFLDVLKREGI